jgi:hypothetical protein
LKDRGLDQAREIPPQVCWHVPLPPCSFSDSLNHAVYASASLLFLLYPRALVLGLFDVCRR